MFLDHYNNEVHVYIDKETIFLKYVTNISLDNFVSIYIENSLKYKILSMIYYHKNLNSIKLCEYLNISLSTLNRKINECNKLLSSFELRIKKFELKGSPLQFSYFYYSLFRNSGINKEIEPGLNDENLVKFLEKSMSIDFTYTQKLSVHIWSKIIFRHKNKFTKENFLDKFSLVNLDSFKDDITFKNLELFYSKFPLYKSI